jgi:hypothetical protein
MKKVLWKLQENELRRTIFMKTEERKRKRRMKKEESDEWRKLLMSKWPFGKNIFSMPYAPVLP